MGTREQLPQELLRQIEGLRTASDQQTGPDRDQQGGDLGYEPIANRQFGEDLAGLRQRQAPLDHTHEESAEDIDEGNHQPGDGVAAHELAGTVHRPVEVGLLHDLLPAALGLLIVDQPGVQIGIDGHLPAGHSVECESGCDFADAAGAFGNHHELDHDDDRENDQPHNGVVACHELAEGANHLPGRIQLLGGRCGQNQPRGSDVEHQPAEGRHQQQRRKNAEFQRRFHRQRRQQDNHGRGDVGCQQQVQQAGWQRHDQHQQADDNAYRQDQVLPTSQVRHALTSTDSRILRSRERMTAVTVV